MSGNLTETLKVRLDAELLAALERHAAELERPASWVARHLIREGLAAIAPPGRKARLGR